VVINECLTSGTSRAQERLALLEERAEREMEERFLGRCLDWTPRDLEELGDHKMGLDVST
jgi:hypothetical protein